MSNADCKYLQYMLEAATAALVFVENRTQDHVINDHTILYPLVRAIELVGENAARVSASARAQFANISWDYVSDLDMSITHDETIDLNCMWEAVYEELPVVVHELSQVIVLPG